MKTTYPVVFLKGFVQQVSIRNKGDAVEVYSVTNSEGFTKSTDYFSKEVFSKDVSNYKVVSPGQFAYNPSRINVGSIDYLKNADRVLVSPLYIVFETGKEIYSDYLLRYLKCNWGNHQIRANTEGAVRDSLKFKGLENIKLPLPPIEDQIRIAHLLGKVERLIAQRKQHLQQLDDLLKSVFLEMFGDPMRNEKGWDKSPIEGLCVDIFDCPHSTPTYSEIETNNYCVRSSDIVNGYIELSKTFQVEDSVYIERIKRYKPQPDDIVYSREGGRLGNAARITGQEKICLGQRMMLFKVNSENRSAFLWSLLESASFKFKLQSLVGGGGAPRVNIKDLKKIVVIKPPTLKQEEFSNVVQKMDQLNNNYQNSLSGLENLYGVLSQKAFKGELDLSRVPLPTEIKSLEESESDEKEISEVSAERENIIDLPAPADLGNLISAEGRRVLIEQWLTAYLVELGSAVFSTQNFMETAKQRMWELVDGQEADSANVVEYEQIQFGVAEYDQIKNLAFHLLESGRLKQTYDDIGNSVLIRSAKG